MYGEPDSSKKGTGSHKKLLFFVKIQLGTRFLPRSNQFPLSQKSSSLVFVLGTRFLPHENRFLRLAESKNSSFDSMHISNFSFPISYEL